MFNFTYPLVLGLIPLLALINYLPYKWKKKSKKLILPTTFILNRLNPKKTVSTSTPKPPWRYLLELALIIIGILGISDLKIPTNTHKVAVLVDDSFSTNALSEDGEQKIFSLIRQEAQKVYKNRKDYYSIFLTSRPELQINEIPKNPSFTSDNLEDSIKKINSKKTFSRIIIVTDKEVSFSNNTNVSVREIKSRLTDNNLAITDASYNQKLRKLNVQIKSYSNQTSQVVLRVLDLESKILIPSQNITLNPNESIKKTFPLLTSKNIALIEILASENSDGIKEDNRRVINLKNSPVKLRFSSTIKLKDSGLDKIQSGFEITENLNNDDQIKGIISYKINQKVSSKATLLIDSKYPGVEFKNVSSGNIFQNTQSEHPFLDYLNLKQSFAGYFKTFSISYPFEVVLGTKTEPILATAINQQGNKITICGFDLLPFDINQNPLRSVLLLNLIKNTFINEIGMNSRNLDEYNPKQVKNEETVNDYKFIADTGLEAKSPNLMETPVPGVEIKVTDQGEQITEYFFTQVKEQHLINNHQSEVVNVNVENLGDSIIDKSVLNFIIFTICLIWCYDLIFVLRSS